MEDHDMENVDVIKKMSAEREARAAAAAAPYTIAQAIDQARWLRNTPDGILDPTIARKTIEGLLSALEVSRCYLKAMEKGEEVFVLRQQDRAAPTAIRIWAEIAERKGCDTKKVDEAYRISKRWLMQPERATKWPT